MSVTFTKSDIGNFRWRVVDSDEDGSVNETIHCSGEFSSESSAIQNMLSCHAVMGIFVVAMAQGKSKHRATKNNVNIESYKDGGLRWELTDGKDIIAISSSSFSDAFDAIDNLIVTYTMLTMYIAQLAQIESY